MAQEIIDLGATPNDGTGDNLRVGGNKINNNFEELYGVGGWEYIEDDGSTPYVIGTTFTKLTFNGLGSNSNTAYLPREIRGTTTLYNYSTQKITAINAGDTYGTRIDMNIASKTGTPNEIYIIIDIGGGVSPTIDVINSYVGAAKTAPFKISSGLPIFSLGTFIANGGQVFVKVDTGTVTLSKWGLLLTRISSGEL